jgi:amino acid transporter
MTDQITSAGPPAVEQDAQRIRLRGKLGVWSIVFIVVAAASPLGVVGGPVPLGIGAGNGAGFPATFIVSTIILLLFAAGFTALTPHVPDAGAFYSYIGKGLGRVTGFGFAFVALLSYLALEIGVYGLIGQGAQALVDSWNGPHLHWAIWAFIAFAVVAYFGHFNIDLSRNVLAVLLLAEVAIVLVLDAVILPTGGAEGISTGLFKPDVILSGAPGIALLFAILSFIGFEATAVFRDEAIDPERTIPRATYVSLILIGVFYAVSTWALITAWGDKAAVAKAAKDSAALLPETTERYLGTAAEHIVQVLFVTSLFACILSFHNIVSRYLFTLANRHVFPDRVGAAHETHGSPHVASALDSVVVAVFVLGTALIGLDPVAEVYTWFAGVSTVGIVLLLLATSVAVLAFFGRRLAAGNLTEGLGRTLIAPALGLVGLVVVFGLIAENLSGLVGGSTAIAIGVIALLVAVFGVGAGIAARNPAIRLD